jgi:arylsulfatase A-like enzyme
MSAIVRIAAALARHRPTAFFALAVAVVLGAASTGSGKARPLGRAAAPVILVSLDTLRADRLNCYGYEARRTSPNLDGLARDSVVFEQHIAAAPWTPPSQMSLLTGLWPSSHGVTSSFQQFHLAEAGLSRVPVLGPSRQTLATRLSERGYRTAAYTGGRTVSGWLGFDRGFAVFRTDMFKIRPRAMDDMLAWLGAQGDRPFLLFWHTFETHAPYLGTAFLDEVLPPVEAAEVARAVREVGVRWSTHDAPLRKMLVERGVYRAEVTEALYTGAIAEADRWVGRLLADLKARGLYDRSLIVVTSDHGEEFSDRSPGAFYNAHGHTLHGEMIRVPLIVKLPRQRAASTRVSAVTRAVDVVPTVLDVVGLPADPGLPGQSLRAVWEGRESRGRVAFAESLEFQEEQKAVRTAGWHLVVTVDPGRVARDGRSRLPPDFAGRALFDLGRDPMERHDLLASGGTKSHALLATALESGLRAHLLALRPDAGLASPTPEDIEALRALGYVQ